MLLFQRSYLSKETQAGNFFIFPAFDEIRNYIYELITVKIRCFKRFQIQLFVIENGLFHLRINNIVVSFTELMCRFSQKNAFAHQFFKVVSHHQKLHAFDAEKRTNVVLVEVLAVNILGETGHEDGCL